MIIWIMVVATLVIAAGFFFGFVVRGDARNGPLWRTLEEGQIVQVPAGAALRAFIRDATNVPITDEPIADLAEATDPSKDPWIDSNYCWVVVCKNHWFHHHPNTFNVHRIPLGETDAVALRPSIRKPFAARCDECGKEYVYKPSEVLRYEMDVPSSFVPHPLFRE